MRLVCGIITAVCGFLLLIHTGPANTEAGIGLLSAGVGLIV